MNLLLGIFWAVGGIGVLVYQTVTGDGRLSFHIAGSTFSSGWVMLVLAAYNGIRWWSRRSVPRTRPYAEEAARRQRIRRIEEPRTPDPNFLFTNEPPAAKPAETAPTNFSLASPDGIEDTKNSSKPPVPPPSE